MYLNTATIIGNLTRDPELKALPSGMQVASLSVATNESFKNSAGEKVDKVEYHNIIAFGKTAENVAMYMKKGSQILVQGKIQTRSWDGADGKKMYRTEIVANTVQFGSKPQGTGGTGSAPRAQATAKDPIEKALDNDGRVDFPEDEINPEDIPF